LTVDHHNTESTQADVIAFLSNPSGYGEKEPLSIHETHDSIVFLAGSHAYKLKRDVKFPYMDYSTPALRKAMCLRELEVNKPTAPEIYQGVRGIVANGDGLTFGEADDPHAIDWVVVMKRFPQEDLLEERRKAGTLAIGEMRALGAAIGTFHRSAEQIRSHGGADGMRRVVDENVTLLRDAPGLSKDTVARYAELSETWLRRLTPALERRREQGLVRRCHGDLHLNNVCMLDGKPMLFDAIEFADAFSCIDVGYDIAFTLMDLDSRDLRPHANALLNRYLERFDDTHMVECLPLFLSCRAAIRSHVAVAAERAGAQPDQGRSRHLLDLAVSYLEPRPPRLIAIGGLSGTGKSTVAQGLAPSVGAAPGAIILRSDVARKAMLGVPETAKLEDDAYSALAIREVYKRIVGQAQLIAQLGHAVIVDATFTSEEERRLARDAAGAANVPFTGLWLEAPRDVLEQRLRERRGDASDADAAVLAKQLQNASVPRDWLKIDASGPVRDVVRAARGMQNAATVSGEI
jgi:aminoglycoside phosphotransferase family enzyme/predicted kinase